MDTNYYLTLKGRSEHKPAKKCLWDLSLACCTGCPPQKTGHWGFRDEPAFSLSHQICKISVIMISVDEVWPFDDSQWEKSLS